MSDKNLSRSISRRQFVAVAGDARGNEQGAVGIYLHVLQAEGHADGHVVSVALHVQAVYADVAGVEAVGIRLQERAEGLFLVVGWFYVEAFIEGGTEVVCSPADVEPYVEPGRRFQQPDEDEAHLPSPSACQQDTDDAADEYPDNQKLFK